MAILWGWKIDGFVPDKLEQFDHPDKKQDKEHFKHLIQVALADGIIEDIELKMVKMKKTFSNYIKKE